MLKNLNSTPHFAGGGAPNSTKGIISQRKSQSAMEYLTTYGFAIIVIVLVLAVVYLFTNSAQVSVPTRCTFSYGAYCNDLIFVSNATSSSAIVLFTNSQQYSVLNPALLINTSSTGEIIGNCEPNFVPPGGAIICNATFSGRSVNIGSLVAGDVKLTGITCPSGNATACEAGAAQTFAGTFTTHASETKSTTPISILLSAKHSSELSALGTDNLTAKVELFGYPLTGAAVNFTSNTSLVQVSPGLVVSNSNGDSYSYASTQNQQGANANITASFAGHKSSVIISFTPSAIISFNINNMAGLNGVKVLTLAGSLQLAYNALPIRILIGTNSLSYSYANTLYGTGGQEYVFSSITGCNTASSSGSISSSTGSCSVLATYVSVTTTTSISTSSSSSTSTSTTTVTTTTSSTSTSLTVSTTSTSRTTTSTSSSTSTTTIAATDYLTVNQNPTYSSDPGHTWNTYVEYTNPGGSETELCSGYCAGYDWWSNSAWVAPGAQINYICAIKETTSSYTFSSWSNATSSTTACYYPSGLYVESSKFTITANFKLVTTTSTSVSTTSTTTNGGGSDRHGSSSESSCYTLGGYYASGFCLL